MNVTTETTKNSAGQELKAVLQLGWPMVFTQLFIMATGFMDTIMAGHYSAADLAGVALGGNILWPVFLLLTGITMALTPISSQFRGQEKVTAIGHQIRQGLWICLVTSTLLTLIMSNAGPIYAFFGVDATAARIATAYLEAVSWGLPPIVFYVALRHVSEGLGQPRPPMLIAASVLPLNGFLNYALIYGKFGFPEMGGVGCGWATAVVFWMQLAVMLFVVRMRYFRRTGLFDSFEGPKLKTISSIIKIGAPIGLAVFLEMAVFAIVSLMIARIGVIEVAANTIAGNLNWLTFVIPMSLGSAASIRVGFHVGARNFVAARTTAAVVYKFSIAYAVVVSILLVLFRFQLVSLYTSDTAVIELAATLLLFIAVYQLVDDSQAVTIGALRGFKDTRVPMVFGIIGYWVIALPMGYALSEGLLLPGLAPGVYGYWVAMTIGLTVVAICAGLRLWHISHDEAKIVRLSAT